MLKRRVLSWLWDHLVSLALLAAIIGMPALVGWIELDAIWSNAVACVLVLMSVTVLPFFAWRRRTALRQTLCFLRSNHCTRIQGLFGLYSRS